MSEIFRRKALNEEKTRLIIGGGLFESGWLMGRARSFLSRTKKARFGRAFEFSRDLYKSL